MGKNIKNPTDERKPDLFASNAETANLLFPDLKSRDEGKVSLRLNDRTIVLVDKSRANTKTAYVLRKKLNLKV